MHASRWVVAVLLFTTFQGALMIIDDTAEWFDVFPGGQSPDEVPMNVSTSDEMAASYRSEGMFRQPVDAPDTLHKCNGTLPPPGCNSTGSTTEEIVYFGHTTQRPTNITLQPKETETTTEFTVGVYVVLGVVGIMVMSLFVMLWVKVCNAAVNPEPQIRRGWHAMELIRGPVFA